MYPLAGPTPQAVIQRPEESPLTLRLNQRVTAQVMEIATDHVTLVMEGVQVVARLTSSEQLAMLQERRVAQFIIRGFSGQTLMLQVATPETAAAPAQLPAQLATTMDLATALLKELGLPQTEPNAQLARALMERGLPVSQSAMQEMEQALAGLPGWGKAEAQTAAALKAAGLPLSPGAVALFQENTGTVAEALARLQPQLRALLNSPGLTARQTELAKAALDLLSSLKVDWSASPQSIAEQLQKAVSVLGRSVEGDLARLQAGENPPPGLLTLAQLRHELSASPQLRALADEIGRFLDAARVMQFTNAVVEHDPAKARWLNLSFPLAQPPNSDLESRVRVAYRSEGQADRLDPKHTRLVLQVELENAEMLEVDLSVVERQIGARVVASSDDLRSSAEAELPGLASGLAELGFNLKTARCDVGAPTRGLDDPREHAPIAQPEAPAPARPRLNLEA
jgi:hypothetical protein